MRFGLLYEAQRPFQGTNVDRNTLYKETLEQCVLAEKVGSRTSGSCNPSRCSAGT
jgi:hypothetical protein